MLQLIERTWAEANHTDMLAVQVRSQVPVGSAISLLISACQRALPGFSEGSLLSRPSFLCPRFYGAMFHFDLGQFGTCPWRLRVRRCAAVHWTQPGNLEGLLLGIRAKPFDFWVPQGQFTTLLQLRSNSLLFDLGCQVFCWNLVLEAFLIQFSAPFSWLGVSLISWSSGGQILLAIRLGKVRHQWKKWAPTYHLNLVFSYLSKES